MIKVLNMSFFHYSPITEVAFS